MTRLHDDESLEEAFTLLLYHLPDSLDQAPTGVAREADQDDARRVGVTDMDQPAKVLVLGQQNALLAMGLLGQFTVIRASLHFTDSKDIMAICSQGAHDGKVTAFIGKESQGGRIHSSTTAGTVRRAARG
jgi:hypothetical protein